MEASRWIASETGYRFFSLLLFLLLLLLSLAFLDACLSKWRLDMVRWDDDGRIGEAMSL